MAYQKINWANGEAGNTPLNANNLNKMDDALDDFESRIGDAEYQIGTLETTVAGHTTAISGKMDKNNPTGTGTLEIMKVKTSELVAKNGNLYLPNAARYTANDTETFPKIADKFDSVDASISSHSDSIWHLNISVAQLNNNKLDKSGEVKISGGLEIESSTGIIGEEPSTSYINGFMLQIPQAEFSEDISVLTDSNDAVVNVGSVINTMKSDIQELKDNAGFEITSASPLNGCSASSIVGIDACGNSTQSGTPTPTNPIPIVDASGDVVANNNLFDVFEEVGKFIDAAGNINTNSLLAYSKAISVTSGGTVKITYKKGGATNDRLHAYNASGTWLRQIALISDTTQSTNTNVTYTFTVGSDVAYIRLSMSKDSTDICVASASNKITLPTLRSVGNVKDELIVNADGSGQIVRRVGTVSLKDLNWTYDSTNRRFFASESTHKQTNRLTKILCNYYSAKCNGESYSADWDNVIYSGGENLIVHDRAYADVSSFKTSLANCVCYVELATPTTTTLTASEVSAIRQLQTYSGTTIIDSALDVKSVTYHAGVKEYIDWRFEQLATLMLGEE